MSGSVCRGPYSLLLFWVAIGLKLTRSAGPYGLSHSCAAELPKPRDSSRNRQGLHCAVKGNIFGYQLHSFKTKKPCQGRVSFGLTGDCNTFSQGLGESQLLQGGIRDLVSQFCRENPRLSSFQPPPTPLPDAWNQDALGPGSNSYRSRGSLHGSRYSRSGATRKGEKAMAGQRKTPTTGAVTVLKPTDRQTPKRAGSAVVTHSRKSGTPVGSGSRVAAPGTIFPTAWSHARRFF